MRTAVDSSVLLDVLGADPEFGTGSRAALRVAYDSGALCACDVVWAEVRAHFEDEAEFEEGMRSLGIAFSALSTDAAAEAGRLWGLRRRVREERGRVIADYLVGAHALIQADALLTRDRGYYRRSFSKLKIVDSSEWR